MSSILAIAIRQGIVRQSLYEEIIIRRLLEQWVSGLEPAVVRDQHTGRIIGLSCADIPPGVVVPIGVYA